MKKILSVIIVIVMLCLLCSCGSTQRYITQDNISLNYNNISAGSGCWMDNNYIRSTEHNFCFDLYLTDDAEKERIDTLSFYYDAHLYNNKLYYFDDIGVGSTKYKFTEYDLDTKNRKNLATITSERVYNYYVTDKHLFIEVGENDSLIRDVVAVSLDTDRQVTVAQNIYSSGIVNGELNYITQKDLKYCIYKYNADSENSELIGDFELQQKIHNDILSGANFNSEYVAFAYSDQETAKSKIYVYRYDDDTPVTCDLEGVIGEFIAYDRFAFFSADGDLYRFCFNDNSTEKIAELSTDDVSLFVGSDDEVYVSSMDFECIRRYSADGRYEDVKTD